MKEPARSRCSRCSTTTSKRRWAGCRTAPRPPVARGCPLLPGRGVHGGEPKVPAFMREGSATYLATNYAGYGEPGTASSGARDGSGLPGRDLMACGYDAVGWYSLVAHVTGTDLWSKMVAAWRAYQTGGRIGGHLYTGGRLRPGREAWGASMVNQPTWGDAWTTPGIGVPTGASGPRSPTSWGRPAGRTVARSSHGRRRSTRNLRSLTGLSRSA